MARGYVRKPNLTRDTLRTIAMVGVVVVAASTSPFFLRNIVKKYFEDKSGKRAWARARKLRELVRRDLIKFEESRNGGASLALTDKGSRLIQSYNIDDLKLQKPARWDKRWRVLIYDIPTFQKRASEAFSRKIKDLGLFPLQRSVWVSAHECFDEIKLIALAFEIDVKKHIHYFRTTEIPREKDIKEFFNL